MGHEETSTGGVIPKFRFLLNKHQIRKRNGNIAPFDQERITDAIFKAAKSVGGTDRAAAVRLSNKVCEAVLTSFHKRSIPAVEQIQDLVEKVLIEQGHARTAKAYILYRDQVKPPEARHGRAAQEGRRALRRHPADHARRQPLSRERGGSGRAPGRISRSPGIPRGVAPGPRGDALVELVLERAGTEGVTR